MALPSSGPLSLLQIQAEFGGPNYGLSTYYRGAGYTTSNNLNVPASGMISINQFHGAVKIVPGSATLGPGANSFTVPACNSLTITLRGAGGGAGGLLVSTNQPPTAGGTGGATSIPALGMAANGGSGGAPSWSPSQGTILSGANGSPGGAGGGTSNITGGGAAGGIGGTDPRSGAHGGTGGSGGAATRTFNVAAGELTTGQTFTINVGSGGAAGQTISTFPQSQPGQPGSAAISWS